MQNLLYNATAVGTMLINLNCGPDYPKCDTDNNYHTKKFYVNNLCQQCHDDQNYPASQQYASNAYSPIPDYCTSANDCNPNQKYQNNTYVNTATSKQPPPTPNTPTKQCNLDAIYFDFDSNTLNNASREKLDTIASYIKSRNLKTVHMTNLTDPHGTKKYNLALNNHRAQSTKKYLKTLTPETTLSSSSMDEKLATDNNKSN